MTKNKECPVISSTYKEPDQIIDLSKSQNNLIKVKTTLNDSEEISARIHQVTSLKESDEVKVLQDQINEKNKVI